MFKVDFIGNLGNDCEVHAEGGAKFYTFKVAHTERWEDAKGVSHEETTWASCYLNDKFGDKVAAYLSRGRKVYVRGRARLNVFSSRIDRCMKAGLSITVDELELLGGQTEAIPSKLVEPASGRIVNVFKAYYVRTSDFPDELPKLLLDQRDGHYAVDQYGFLMPEAQQPSVTDAQTETETIDTSSDNEAGKPKSKMRKS